MSISTYVIRESSSGTIYKLITNKPVEEIYKMFASQINKIDTSGDFDTGNVDIDIEKIVSNGGYEDHNKVIEMFTEDKDD